jgi:hypothetical protein
VADDDGVVAGAAREGAAVADAALDVADDGPLRERPDREDVADAEVGAAAAVDGLAGVHALGGDEELLLLPVAEGVAEGDAGERGAAAGVVHDVGDEALEVAAALAEVERAEAGGALAVVGVGLEHGPRRALALRADDTAHGGGGGGGFFLAMDRRTRPGFWCTSLYGSNLYGRFVRGTEGLRMLPGWLIWRRRSAAGWCVLGCEPSDRT